MLFSKQFIVCTPLYILKGITNRNTFDIIEKSFVTKKKKINQNITII